MNAKQIIEAIRGMRERETLTAIIDAAEARDCHLSGLESDERRKRHWAKFSHLRKGDTVFIHVKPAHERYRVLFGVPLYVKKVMPRKKEIVIDSGIATVPMTVQMMSTFKLSEEPTGEALEHVLKGGDGG